MAKVLDSFSWANQGNKSKYPWEQWFDGQIWELQQGVDFDLKLTTFQTSVNKSARLKRITVRTSVVPERSVVVVQRIGGKKNAK